MRGTDITRIFAFGGGVQSVAVMILQSQGKLLSPFDIFLMADVGHDSENPATVEYVEEIIIPFANNHDLNLQICRKQYRGQPDTIMGLIKRTPASNPLPMYYSTTAMRPHSCSIEFKQKPQDAWIKVHKFSDVEVGLGYTIDEFRRARKETWMTHYDVDKKRPIGFSKKFVQPLLHMQLTRNDCRSIIINAGLPMPQRSACWFCPVAKPGEWMLMRQQNPELFREAIELEQFLNRKKGVEYPHSDYLFLHRYRQPLDRAVGEQVMLPGFDDDDLCGGSSCMT